MYLSFRISEDDVSWRQHLATLNERKPFRDFQYRYYRRDGSVGWVSVSGKPIFDGSGAYLGYRGASSEISALKEAEHFLQTANQELEQRVEERTRELRHNEARLRDVVETTYDRIWETDENHRFSDVSDFGHDPDWPARKYVIGRTRW